VILTLDRFTPQVVARCLHGLPPDISIISIDSGGTVVDVVSSYLNDQDLSDHIIRQCLDEEIRLRLLEETQSERRLIYAYALTGLLPEDLDQ
jgi:hypothetical protein